jgi:hypothetical protein
MEILSLVNFDNIERTAYLDRSFGSYYTRYPRVRHIVIDSSKNTDAQAEQYRRYGVELCHRPGASYGSRLKFGLSLVKSDFFLFFPDDFVWIFEMDLTDAVNQARQVGIDSIRLCPRGMSWYSKQNPIPIPWYHGTKVISGEVLVREGDLFISKRRWTRDFHEQFTLSCNIMRTDFARWVVDRIPATVINPSKAEIWAYIRLIFKRYFVCYYKMQTPAFHFADLMIEKPNPKNIERAETNLLEENYEIFNRLCNNQY